LNNINTTADIDKYFLMMQKSGHDPAKLMQDLTRNAAVLFDADGGKKPVENYTISAFLQMQKDGKLPVLRSIDGPQSTDTAEVGKVHTQAKKNETTPDFEILAQYISCGFTLTACKQIAHKEVSADGKEVFKTDYIPCNWNAWNDYQGRRIFETASAKNGNADTKYVHTLEDLETAIHNGVTLFRFYPADKNYLCFDIDKGHENEIDGVKVFLDYFAERDIKYDFFAKSMVYVDTPSGGKHIYFDATTAQDIEKFNTEFMQNVEIRGKGNRKDLTAAGSVKNGKRYILHGDIAKALQIPNFLIKHVTPKPRPEYKKPGNYTGERKGYSLDWLVKTVIADNAGESRNNLAYKIGYRIGKQYDLESIKTECLTHLEFANFPIAELETALQSGMKNSKY